MAASGGSSVEWLGRAPANGPAVRESRRAMELPLGEAPERAIPALLDTKRRPPHNRRRACMHSIADMGSGLGVLVPLSLVSPARRTPHSAWTHKAPRILGLVKREPSRCRTKKKTETAGWVIAEATFFEIESGAIKPR